jgi:hypothetical protein
MAMMALDPPISFAQAAEPATASVQPERPKLPSSPPMTKPSLANPSKGSIGPFIAALLSGIFL